MEGGRGGERKEVRVGGRKGRVEREGETKEGRKEKK